MKFLEISQLNKLQKDNKDRIAALGFFDGIHKAHQKIINNTVNKANKINKIPVVITFNKSPKEYFLKENIKLLTPKDEKIKLLKKLGVKEVYILDFNEELSLLSREQFIENVLLQLNVKEIYCGYDYKFGYRGLGYPEFIAEYTSNKIVINKIDKLTLFDEKISTTKLNEIVKEGNLKKYIDYTGRAYSIKGTVIKGKQLGRTIGFPTANINLKYDYLLPEKLGVYFTKITILKKDYFGITNIGNNPTVNQNNRLFIETHILDFDEFIYGEEIKLSFYDFIRNEKKFSGIEELKEQLKKDKEEAIKLKKLF